jgi:Flp pilus assembly pilin Flp
MNALRKKVLGLANDQRGGALVEYVIVVALVAAVAVGAWETFGTQVSDNIGAAGTKIGGAVDTATGDGASSAR